MVQWIRHWTANLVISTKDLWYRKFLLKFLSLIVHQGVPKIILQQELSGGPHNPSLSSFRSTRFQDHQTAVETSGNNSKSFGRKVRSKRKKWGNLVHPWFLNIIMSMVGILAKEISTMTPVTHNTKNHQLVVFCWPGIFLIVYHLALELNSGFNLQNLGFKFQDLIFMQTVMKKKKSKTQEE